MKQLYQHRLQRKIHPDPFFTAMVKIKNPLDTKYRDSTRGWTGKLNWSGPNGRTHMSPVSIHTSFKGSYKQFFSRLVKLWHSLSLAERMAWSTFSDNNETPDRYGNLILIGGYQWFVRLNTRLTQGGHNAITAPPANDIPTYTPTIQAVQSPTTDDLEASISPAPAAGESVFWARSINLPVSQAAPVSTFHTGGVFLSTSPTPYVMVEKSEIKSTELRFKFRLYAVDTMGRSPGLVYDDMVNVTLAP